MVAFIAGNDGGRCQSLFLVLLAPWILKRIEVIQRRCIIWQRLAMMMFVNNRQSSTPMTIGVLIPQSELATSDTVVAHESHFNTN